MHALSTGEMTDRQFVFPPFTLDVENQFLLRRGTNIFLRPKAFAVLTYLVEHPHRLVSKDELMRAVWPGAKVVDATLRVTIQEIRRALGDDAAKPKFIETAGKSGYRFLPSVALKFSKQNLQEVANTFVGRTTELEQLSHYLEFADSGKRQALFIGGEPGIGKTTLVDVFSNNIAQTSRALVARGQCIEQYGAREAYLPILDVLEHLCRASDGERTIGLLRKMAPSWLLNLPLLISAEEREALGRQCLGITAERRLREIAGFLETIATDRTLVLILEDLHWLDPSTLVLISFLLRRREHARLLVIGTCRPRELAQRNHPLKTTIAELALHNFCSQIPLKPLSLNAVEKYLAAHFDHPVSASVVRTVYARSEGNPLFMVNMTEYLTSRQVIVREKDAVALAASNDHEPVPSTLRDLITRQLEVLSPEDQELLGTASVAGMKFPVPLVAAHVLGRTREEVEQRCRELAERDQFLQYSGSRKRPSGTSTTLYGFTHALYHDVIYERVGEARRRRLHKSIGALLEKVFQGATEQVAAELALHFERAGDFERAVSYLILAAQNATRQSAYQEAIDYSAHGLGLLHFLLDDARRADMELHLQVTMSVSLASTCGYADGDVREAYARATLLCQKVKDQSLRMQALVGLFTFYLMGGKPRHALDLGKQMILAARSMKNRAYVGDGHTCTGMALFYQGQYIAAQDYFDQAREAYGEGNGASQTIYQTDYLDYLLTYTAVNLWLLGYSAINLWVLGYPDRAKAQVSRESFLMQQLSHPLSTVVNQVMLASYHQCRSEANETLKLSNEGIRLASEYGFFHWLTAATMCKGWALANLGKLEEGTALLREGLNNWHLIGSKTEAMRFTTLLAENCLLSNRTKQGLSLINEALKFIEETEDRFFQSEVFRIKGELLKTHQNGFGKIATSMEAESSFVEAIEIARRQKAKSFELRATVSLARLWQETGKKKEAKRMLAKIYGWFTEGFDSLDLTAAQELLDGLQ
jgi:DNA-binding winged helix-turn-helix (wHTH) protein/predicted ATPase